MCVVISPKTPSSWAYYVFVAGIPGGVGVASSLVDWRRCDYALMVCRIRVASAMEGWRNVQLVIRWRLLSEFCTI